MALAGVLVLLAGCAGGSGQRAVGPNRVELTVSAAASLQAALTEVARSYEKAHPGVRISLNFGSSGSLSRQIEQGAPVDVFVSAARREMDGLQQQGLIDEDTRRDLWANRIVLVVSARTGKSLASWQDLAGSSVRRVAIGTPETVPVGLYAKETLQHLGLWEKVEPKLVLGKDVLQVVSYVKTGNVDAGVVFRTDGRDPTLRVVAEAPPGSHRPVVYPGAVVKASPHPEAARDFLAFLAGKEAAAICERYGFLPLGDGR